MTKKDKINRKNILKNLREKQNNELINTLPFSQKHAKDLFDLLDLKLTESGCDHTFKLVEEFSQSINCNFDMVEQWLNDNGAWCDCEALANVEEKYEDLL